MDFLITGFLLWVFNLFSPTKKTEPKSKSIINQNQNDIENGAAFFFSTYPLQDDQPEDKVNEEYYHEGGPKW